MIELSEKRQQAWHRRYDRACARLESAPAMARLARLAAEVRATPQPAARVVVGGKGLMCEKGVVLFPGSFNPLTRAHLATALAASSVAEAALAWGVAVASIDKEGVGRASLGDRLAQLAAYTVNQRSGTVAIFNRGLYVDQVRAIRAHMPPGVRLFVVVGFDKIVQIFDPAYYSDRDAALDALFGQARFLVAPRGDDGRDALGALLSRPENHRYADQVSFLPLPPRFAADSSTEARQLAAKSTTVALSRLMPPEAVALARCTGAYQRIHSATTTDAYTVRQRWIGTLASWRERDLRLLPPLSTLVGMTRAKNATGTALRRWLDDAHGDPAEALALVRAG